MEAPEIFLSSVRASEAGRVESEASTHLAGQRVYKSYTKDGLEQVAVEAFKCKYSTAVKAIKEALGPSDTATPWEARWTVIYEFDDK